MSDKTKDREAAWNPQLYDQKHSYVWQYGADLLSLLAPMPGERILDLGCGTGHLTSKLAESSAKVLGMDRSEEMIQAARKAYPQLEFEVRDARDLKFTQEFDAVFSNAALHWISEPEKVIDEVWNALRPGGRFVGEFGGYGNVGKMFAAFQHAAQEINPRDPVFRNPWYFPRVSQYASLLEDRGFEVRYMTLVDRFTQLDDGEVGMRNWMGIFVPDLLASLRTETKEIFLQKVEDLLRPSLFRDGNWFADYRRLRFAAYK
jgi:trans-aconitate methyltransferase